MGTGGQKVENFLQAKFSAIRYYDFYLLSIYLPHCIHTISHNVLITLYIYIYIGACVCVSFEPYTRHCLASIRPSRRCPNSRHVVSETTCTLYNLNPASAPLIYFSFFLLYNNYTNSYFSFRVQRLTTPSPLS